jgi:hypothetical protein
MRRAKCDARLCAKGKYFFSNFENGEPKGKLASLGSRTKNFLAGQLHAQVILLPVYANDGILALLPLPMRKGQLCLRHDFMRPYNVEFELRFRSNGKRGPPREICRRPPSN